MAINNTDLIQGTRGTIFYAPAETPMPEDGPAAFSLTKDTVGDGKTAWQNIGHTSNDNKVSFSTDGGDSNTHDTWLMAGARTTYETTNMTVSGASVQADIESLRLFLNGWDSGDGGIVGTAEKREQKLALFILAYDSGANTMFGIYMPNTSFTYSGSAFIDLSSDNFVEFGFEAKVMTSSTLKTNDSGNQGTFVLYPPEAFSGKTISKVELTNDSGAALPTTGTVGGTAQLGAKVTYDDNSTEQAGSNAGTFNSSDPSVIKIEGSKATFVAAGTADLTANVGGKVSTSVKVTVTA